MRQTLVRWTIYFVSLLLAGPVAGMLVGSVHSIDGGAASPLVSNSPFLGLVAGVGAVAIALGIGLLTARLLSLAPAMTASGIVVAWAAWRTAEVDTLIRTARSGSPLVMLSVEGVIFGVLGLVIAIGCWLVSRQDGVLVGRARRGAEGPLATWVFAKVFAGKSGVISVAVGFIAGAVAAWLIAATPLKGQAVFAAIAAGTFSAAACRLVDFEAPVPTMFMPIVLLAIVGPLTGLVMAGPGGVVAGTFKGTLFPLANISPLDWIAGGLLGIPMGVSWAGSMIEKRIPEAPAKA